MKLNFGSAHDKIEGYKNVDGLDWSGNTDVLHDLRDFPYPFEDNSADAIRCVETLEHISFRHTHFVLSEFFRILKKEGTLHIQVPDCGKAMNYYTNGLVCDCVPHKSTDGTFKANKDCNECGGKAIINTQRWLFSFTGAQKHHYDSHLNVFTAESLGKALQKTGFFNFRFKDDIYKLKINAVK